MTERPSTYWRNEMEREARAVATGELERECASFLGSYSEPFLRALDAVLADFESDARSLAAASDADVLAAVERVVLALNETQHLGSIDTDEREHLCLYIDEVLTENGVDVAALEIRNNLSRYEITDRWRRW